MFAIENAQTRKSLKSVFENIFAKYGRDFEEDDEIDLASMEVTKPGGHLARLKPLAFGRAFRDRRHMQERANESTEEEEENIEYEVPLGVDDDVFETEKRIRPKANPEQVAQIRSSFNYAVATKVKKRPRIKVAPTTFDSALLEICRYSTNRTKSIRISHDKNCFDCTLLRILKAE